MNQRISLALALLVSAFALVAHAQTASFAITSPGSGTAVSGTFLAKGTVGSTWVNIAGFDQSNNKICADATPSNGTFTLSCDSTNLPGGTAIITITAFSVPAGQPGGTSSSLTLSVNVSGSSSGTPVSNPCTNYYQSGIAAPAGYGAAYDLFSSQHELEVSVDCSGSSPVLKVGSGLSNQYIYNEGYIYQSSAWQPITLTSGTSLISNAWYTGIAQATLPGTAPVSWIYAVGYVCSWNGIAWQCGCSDTACTTSYWQLQAFEPAAASTSGNSGLTPPAPAAALGFTKLAFNQGGSAGWNIDLNNTGGSGYDWYLCDGHSASNYPVSNGVLTILDGGHFGCQLQTAKNANSGQSFSGGFYVEAAISMNPSCVNTGSGSWPAFWGNTRNKLGEPATDQWSGQPSGFEHFIELDFMEFWGSYYTFANIDWYGIYGQSCGFFCTVNNVPNNTMTVPAGTDWTKYNVYGAAVVPSNLNRGAGYTLGYFNNQPSGKKNTWGTYNPNAGPPPSGNQVFALTDVQPFYLIMGTGPSCPMKVSYVRVWQRP